MPKSVSLLLISSLLAGLAGCRTAAPAAAKPTLADGVSKPETPISVSVPTVNRTWVLVPDKQLFSFSSVTMTKLRPEGITLATNDSVSTQVSLDLSVSRNSNSFLIQGTVRAVLIAGSSRISTDMETQESPKAFTGFLKQGDLFIKPFSSEPGKAVHDCTESRPVIVSALQRALVLPPEHITPTTAWSDTVTISTCLGTIPVRSTTIRSYWSPREVTLNSHRSITFERRDIVTLNGNGPAGQHQVSITADGSGIGSTSVDAETGALVQATGRQSTRIQITSSGRQQIFIQTTNENTSRNRELIP